MELLQTFTLYTYPYYEKFNEKEGIKWDKLTVQYTLQFYNNHILDKYLHDNDSQSLVELDENIYLYTFVELRKVCREWKQFYYSIHNFSRIFDFGKLEEEVVFTYELLRSVCEKCDHLPYDNNYILIGYMLNYSKSEWLKKDGNELVKE